MNMTRPYTRGPINYAEYTPTTHNMQHIELYILKYFLRFFFFSLILNINDNFVNIPDLIYTFVCI